MARASAGAPYLAYSLHDPRYKRLVAMLVAARKAARLTQRDVAARLKRPPSYIGKLESRQRRLDAIELIDVLEAMNINPVSFMKALVADLHKRREKSS